jgi:hypothetical protein
VLTDDAGDLGVGDVRARAMQPALQKTQGFTRPLTVGDGGQNPGHGGIGRDEAFAPRTQQEHLQPGFLFGAEGTLFELGEQLS